MTSLTTERWRVDWSDTRAYNHRYSDITDSVVSAYVSTGRVDEVAIRADAGALDIDNATYDWDAGRRVSWSDYLSPHRVEYTVGGSVVWSGAGIVEPSPLGADGRRVRLRLYSAAEIALAKRIDVDETSTDTVGDALTRITLEAGQVSRASLLLVRATQGVARTPNLGPHTFAGNVAQYMRVVELTTGGMWLMDGITAIYVPLRQASLVSPRESETIRSGPGRGVKIAVRDQPAWRPYTGRLYTSYTLDGSGATDIGMIGHRTTASAYSTDRIDFVVAISPSDRAMVTADDVTIYVQRFWRQYLFDPTGTGRGTRTFTVTGTPYRVLSISVESDGVHVSLDVSGDTSGRRYTTSGASIELGARRSGDLPEVSGQANEAIYGGRALPTPSWSPAQQVSGNDGTVIDPDSVLDVAFLTKPMRTITTDIEGGIVLQHDRVYSAAFHPHPAERCIPVRITYISRPGSVPIQRVTWLALQQPANPDSVTDTGASP